MRAVAGGQPSIVHPHGSKSAHAMAMTYATPFFGLDEAVALATERHADQTERSGIPYISHPLRVMGRLTTERARMVAVLHDTIEDTTLTAAELLQLGCPPDVVDAVVALTHPKSEPMHAYLDRLLANPLALEVKWADLSDNNDPARVAWMRLHDPNQRRHLDAKYSDVCSYLAAGCLARPDTRTMARRFLAILRSLDPARAAYVSAQIGVRLDTVDGTQLA